jgi:hypothetical protein
MKQKKCKVCLTLFTPLRPLQSCCNWQCANIHAKELNEKKQDKEWKQRKAKMKSDLMSLSDWLKIAQKHFNHYIRLRDKGNNCISCGKQFFKDEIVHASHYKPAGTCYNVRFNEDNVWISCVKCNTHLSGNGIEYRKRLVEKIGIERVEKVEELSTITRKFSISEVKEIIEIYKAKIKTLK